MFGKCVLPENAEGLNMYVFMFVFFSKYGWFLLFESNLLDIHIHNLNLYDNIVSCLFAHV